MAVPCETCRNPLVDYRTPLLTFLMHASRSNLGSTSEWASPEEHDADVTVGVKDNGDTDRRYVRGMSQSEVTRLSTWNGYTRR